MPCFPVPTDPILPTNGAAEEMQREILPDWSFSGLGAGMGWAPCYCIMG